MDNYAPTSQQNSVAGVDPAPGQGHESRMLSSKAKYAVRAATMLAERAAIDDWTPTAEVAEQQRIPRKFLEAILVQLRDHGIVDSRRGSHGGHHLSRDASEISVADIIRVFDGPLALTPCASVTRFRPCTDCVDIASCRLQHLMRQARDAVAGVLENCSLATLAAPGKTGLAAPGKKPQPASRTTRATTSARRS
jgi:Rrf2 family protein